MCLYTTGKNPVYYKLNILLHNTQQFISGGAMIFLW